MKKLKKEEIDNLSLEEAKERIVLLQIENANLEETIAKQEKHQISDGAKIEAVKEILNNLWCA